MSNAAEQKLDALILHVINQFSFVCHDKKRIVCTIITSCQINERGTSEKFECQQLRAVFARDQHKRMHSIILFHLLPNNAPTNVNIYLSQTLLNVTRKDAKCCHDSTKHLFLNIYRCKKENESVKIKYKCNTQLVSFVFTMLWYLIGFIYLERIDNQVNKFRINTF